MDRTIEDQDQPMVFYVRSVHSHGADGAAVMVESAGQSSNDLLKLEWLFAKFQALLEATKRIV